MERSLEKAYLETVNNGNLPIIVVTTGTQDFADSYVARLHVHNVKTNRAAPTEVFAKADSLDCVRKAIPMQCSKLERSENDDLVIVETWL
ncbi:hypothetical protein [Vibrio lentus]|uniref:hypothetical protein n=1 Tax=Vibrio lentus TaxID=136468 RepID=UPI001E55FA62|nr:hypothetical protein [Vibrio lentus]MCC4838115.1 hypothetical protein [Vibrio lentus]